MGGRDLERRWTCFELSNPSLNAETASNGGPCSGDSWHADDGKSKLGATPMKQLIMVLLMVCSFGGDRDIGRAAATLNVEKLKYERVIGK